MLVHVYDKKTKEYIKSKLANIDPLESKKLGREVYLTPKYSTIIEPPPTNQNEIACFSKQDEIWEVCEDHRGKTVYHINDQSPFIVMELGSISNNYVEIPPNSPFDFWNGTEWVLDENKQRIHNDMTYLRKVFNKKLQELVIQKMKDDGVLNSEGGIGNYDEDYLDVDLLEKMYMDYYGYDMLVGPPSNIYD